MKLQTRPGRREREDRTPKREESVIRSSCLPDGKSTKLIPWEVLIQEPAFVNRAQPCPKNHHFRRGIDAMHMHEQGAVSMEN